VTLTQNFPKNKLYKQETNIQLEPVAKFYLEDYLLSRFAKLLSQGDDDHHPLETFANRDNRVMAVATLINYPLYELNWRRTLRGRLEISIW
ncbi:11390_t:CDS:2, partial [Cetraspora pellucida]